MKNAKKVFAMLIVLALAISMAIPVSAEEVPPTGKITIGQAKEGNTYKIYRIADLKVSADGENYAYYLPQNSPWESFFTPARGFELKASVDGTGTKSITFTEPNEFDEAKFAKDALAYAESNSIGHTSSKECATGATTVTFEDLPYGYYLVDTTVGTICSLDTLSGGSVTIDDKHVVPTIEKKVNGKDLVDAFIGEVVNYTVSVGVNAGVINYKVTDTLSSGLTFDGTPSVKVENASLAAGTGLEAGKQFEIAGAKDYLFTQTQDAQNRQILTFVFDNDTIKKYEGKTIVIEYTAKVNANAVINGANANDVKLSYGNTTKTVDDHVDVYTWDMSILKTKSTGDPLSGATFELYQGTKAADNGVELTAGGNGNYTYVRKGTATKITGGSSFNIKGLKSGTYVLHEVAAPDGYNKLSNDIVITITHDDGATSVTYSGKIGTENATFKDGVLQVVNNSGTELPHTGATGTIIFITVGGLMVVAMGVLLVVRKRMSKVVYTR